LISAGPLKTSLLELLAKLHKQEKRIPLSLEQRFELVKALLNSKVKEFDFAILENPNDENVNKRARKMIALRREKIFNELWTELAEKCPDLLKIREMRPEMVEKTPPKLFKLNKLVFSFSKLLCLETNCIINPGLVLFKLARIYLFKIIC